MDIGINFPSQAELIAKEAARFRALTPEEQTHEVARCLRLYRFLKSVSDDPGRIERFAEEEERRDWLAVQDFVTRHG